MADNGIKISLGFTDDWKSEISKIQKQLDSLSINTSKIGLDKALEKQLASIQTMLNTVSNEIEKMFNDRTSFKALNSISRTIDLLSNGFDAMGSAIKSLGGDASSIEKITSELSDMKNTADVVTDSVKKLQQTTGKTVSFFDPNELKKQRKAIKDLGDYLENFKTDDSYIDFRKIGTNYEAGISVIKEAIKRYKEEVAKLNSMRNDKGSLPVSSEVASQVKEVQMWGNGIEELRQNFKLNLNEIDASVAEMQKNVNLTLRGLFQRISNQRKKLQEEINKSVTLENTESGNNAIRVPLTIKNRKGFQDDVINLVNTLNDKLTENPIEVEVHLMSAAQARGTKTLLDNIQDELINIDDGEVTERLLGLINKLNARVENALTLTINIETEVARQRIDKFVDSVMPKIQQLESELNEKIEMPFFANINSKEFSAFAMSIINIAKSTKILISNLKEMYDNVESASALKMFISDIDELKNSFMDLEIQMHNFLVEAEQEVVITIDFQSGGNIPNEESAIELLMQLPSILDKLEGKKSNIKINLLFEGLEKFDSLKKFLLGDDTVSNVDLGKRIISSYKNGSFNNENDLRRLLGMETDPIYKVNLVPDMQYFESSLKEGLIKISPIPIGVYIADVDLKESGNALKIPVNKIVGEKKKADDSLEREQKKVEALKKGSALLEEQEETIREIIRNLVGKESIIMSQEMSINNDGWIETRSVIRDIEGEVKEYVHTTVEGEETIQTAVNMGTKKILNQTRAYERFAKEANDIFERQQTLEANGGYIGEVNIGDENWERLINRAKELGVEVEGISKIIRILERDGREWFQFFDREGNKRKTIGMDSDEVLYEKQTVESYMKTLEQFEKIISKIPSAYKKAIKNGDSLSIGEFIDDLKEGMKLYQEFNRIRNAGYTDEETGNFMSIVSDEDVNRIEEMNNRLTEFFTNIQNNGVLDEDTIRKAYEGKYTEEYIDSLIASANELREALEKPFDERGINDVSEALKKMSNTMEGVSDDANKLAKDTKIVNMIKTIRTELNKNSAMLPQYKAQYKQLLDQLEAGFSGAEKISKDAIQGILVQLMRLQGEVQASGKVGLNFIDRFKKAVSTNLVQYVARFFSIQDIVRYVRTISSSIVDLDTALIDLKKTTVMDSDQLESFYTESTNVAKSMGVSTKQIIEQAAAWSRLGYNTEEASTKMAELSSKFKAISPGMDLENATDGLVSTMQAFHIKVEDAEREIIDSINRVGNTMATSNDEIVEMLKRSSAAMYAANNTLAETIALEAASVQITRNASVTGTAFRTISMRIRGKLSLPPYMETYMLCA